MLNGNTVERLEYDLNGTGLWSEHKKSQIIRGAKEPFLQNIVHLLY